MGKIIVLDTPKKINDLKKIQEELNNKNTFLVESVWNDLPDFKKIHNNLLKLGFKVFYKKPVFYKKIKKPEPTKLVFKQRRTKDMFKIYSDFIKNSKAPDYQLDKKNIKKSFNETLSSKKKWNLLALDSNNNPVGLLILEGYMDYYTTNLVLVAKKYRGKGYSYELLKKSEEEFVKIGDKKHWYESTWEKDLPMIKAFKKYGFKQKRVMYFYII